MEKSDYEPLVVRPKQAEHLLQVSHARLYEMINAGELESYLEGPHRKILMRSIHARIARKLKERAA